MIYMSEGKTIYKGRKSNIYGVVFAFVLIYLIAFASDSSATQFITIFLYILVGALYFCAYDYSSTPYLDKLRNRYIIFLAYMLISTTTTTIIQLVSGRQFLERTESTFGGLVLFTKVTMGAVAILFLWKLYENTEMWYKFIVWFLTVFCIYCMSIEYINKISIVRDSAAASISKNHIAALVYTGIPLLLFCQNHCKKRIISVIALILSAFTIFLSASRTAYAILIGVFCIYIFFTRVSIAKKLGLITSMILAAYFVYLRFSEIIIRGVSFMNISNDDGRRAFLRSCAIAKFEKYGLFEKLIGTGSDQIHIWNIVLSIHSFPLELLISVGVLGLSVYVLFCGGVVFYLLKNSERYKWSYIIQELFVFIATGLFQPFYSTSYICGMLFYISIMVIFMAKGDNENERIE